MKNCFFILLFLSSLIVKAQGLSPGMELAGLTSNQAISLTAKKVNPNAPPHIFAGYDLNPNSASENLVTTQENQPMNNPLKVSGNIPIDTCICTQILKRKDEYDSLPTPKVPATFNLYYKNNVGCNLTITRITLLEKNCRDAYNHDLTVRPKYRWTVASSEALDDKVWSGPDRDSLIVPDQCNCFASNGINSTLTELLFNIYPNQFSEELNITALKGQTMQYVKLSNIVGTIIYHERLNDKAHVKIKTSLFPSGSYLVSIYYQQQGLTKSLNYKVIK